MFSIMVLAALAGAAPAMGATATAGVSVTLIGPMVGVAGAPEGLRVLGESAYDVRRAAGGDAWLVEFN